MHSAGFSLNFPSTNLNVEILVISIFFFFAEESLWRFSSFFNVFCGMHEALLAVCCFDISSNGQRKPVPYSIE